MAVSSPSVRELLAHENCIGPVPVPANSSRSAGWHVGMGSQAVTPLPSRFRCLLFHTRSLFHWHAIRLPGAPYRGSPEGTVLLAVTRSAHDPATCLGSRGGVRYLRAAKALKTDRSLTCGFPLDQINQEFFLKKAPGCHFSTQKSRESRCQRLLVQTLSRSGNLRLPFSFIACSTTRFSPA